MKGSHTKPQSSESGSSEAIDWELRPGGMLVQKREDDVDSSVPMIKIKVFHDSYQHQVTVPAKSTFGELKAVLAQETGLAPDEQRLLFRGKEKDDDECLHMAGVKDMSKVVLLQDPASRERKLEQLKHDQENSKACEAVAGVRDEVDKLVEKVNALKYSIHRGSKVKDQEFVVLTELLMRLLLKLDSIEADGEAKIQRKAEQRWLSARELVKLLGKVGLEGGDNNIKTGRERCQWFWTRKGDEAGARGCGAGARKGGSTGVGGGEARAREGGGVSDYKLQLEQNSSGDGGNNVEAWRLLAWRLIVLLEMKCKKLARVSAGT